MADDINSIAEQAIGLFLEYRDVHGYSEESARNQALIDLAEGASVEIPEDHPADCVCDAHSVEELMRRPSHAVIPMPDADLDAIRRRDADEGTAPLTEGERRVLDAVARTYPTAARAFARRGREGDRQAGDRSISTGGRAARPQCRRTGGGEPGESRASSHSLDCP